MSRPDDGPADVSGRRRVRPLTVVVVVLVVVLAAAVAVTSQQPGGAPTPSADPLAMLDDALAEGRPAYILIHSAT
ncbi:MAG: hypothetical protein JXP37_07025 [Coriobacteriia bacterium]|nr:hypothetical protein [Coriobacteriia bacterium]